MYESCIKGLRQRLARSLSDLGVRREGKRDRDQNLCKFEANSGLFNEDLRKFWPISAFPQQNHPKSDRLLERPPPIRIARRNPRTSINLIQDKPRAGCSIDRIAGVMQNAALQRRIFLGYGPAVRCIDTYRKDKNSEKPLPTLWRGAERCNFLPPCWTRPVRVLARSANQ